MEEKGRKWGKELKPAGADAQTRRAGIPWALSADPAQRGLVRWGLPLEAPHSARKSNVVPDGQYPGSQQKQIKILLEVSLRTLR